jgi:hypothetical protein
MKLFLYRKFINLFIAGQNGAVKEISKNGWNNHLSQVDGGMAKNSTTNYGRRSTETPATNSPGVNFALKFVYYCF